MQLDEAAAETGNVEVSDRTSLENLGILIACIRSVIAKLHLESPYVY